MKKSLNHREILLKKAKEDLEAAEKLIESGDFSEEIVLFHCQQAIEKALKAFLDSRGVIYPKIHDLETLLTLCIEKDCSFEKISFVTTLTPYAVEIRYDEFVALEKNEVREIVVKGKQALEFITGKVGIN